MLRDERICVGSFQLHPQAFGIKRVHKFSISIYSDYKPSISIPHFSATAIQHTERLRTGTFSWPPEGKFPVPYYRLEGSAIAIWRGFPSKLDNARPAPANCGRTL